MRVWEYARKNGLKTKELLRILDENGIYNKTAQSTITEEEITQAQIKDLQEDSDIPIDKVEINTKDFYDIKSELIDVYPQANYYVAISSRGTGKSTNSFLLILKEYLETGCPSVLIRRRDIELNEGKLKEVFGEIISLGFIRYWSQDRWNSIQTVGMRSYLCKRDDDGKIVDKDKNFFMYAIPLAESGNIKGIQLNRAEDYVWVKYIVFDEIIPVDGFSYLPNESGLLWNTISTIIRHYDKAKVILLGNCIVSSACPVLNDMQIDIYSFKLGEKRLYKYDAENESDVNYCAVHFIDKRKYKGVANKNNKMFNFGNQKTLAITGNSDDATQIWELDRDFLGIPRKYKKSDIVFEFYWLNCDEIFKGEVVDLGDCRFIYNHRTGHKIDENWLNEDENLILSSEIIDPRPNWISSLRDTQIKIVAKLKQIILSEKVYHQNAWVANYWKNLMNNL